MLAVSNGALQHLAMIRAAAWSWHPPLSSLLALRDIQHDSSSTVQSAQSFSSQSGSEIISGAVSMIVFS